ncbi:hypothetical protein PV04_00786 [Phialophora macrospora]|uniref:Protein BIG1 n=1 Tax=Phialophora macrospora TaxID=1851006 RepID=A0A0D2GJP5_9EURO|nr:hypothetical protein PV04_00786 [Phialophora macrospora]
MRLLGLCALALAAGRAHGYLDTAPFFMFSTSELLTTTSPIQSASLLTSDVALSLSSCPSDYYIFVSQQGVSLQDYSNSKKSTPWLSKALSPSQAAESGIRSSLTVSDVLGPLDSSALIDALRTECGVSTTTVISKHGGIPTNDLATSPQLIQLNLPAPSSDKRASDLSANDAFLASLIDLLPKQNYTVLYTTTRSADGMVVALGKEPLEYDMESQLQESLHLDLKRDLGVHASANKTGNNQTMIDGPLFDKYQFLTPGIFMGFLVGFLLLSMLYVAISAVASLQVTYAAFDKEQGHLAGKK